HFRIPSDQYPKRPADLAAFVQAWDDLTGRNDAPDDIKHYIVTKRKNSDWVTLDDDYERMAGPPEGILTLAEWTHLAQIYAELFIARDIGSDQLSYDPALRASLAEEFYRRTGRRVRGELLHALIEAKRKRGEWLAAKAKDGREPGIGF